VLVSERAVRPLRADYPHLVPFGTRWMDNDIYGHVNNVTYYSYFDTVANAFMIENGLEIHDGPVIGVVAESTCRYHAEIAFPDRLEVGLRVDRLGTSAVTWGIGIFKVGVEEAVANGQFVHVIVDRVTRRPVPIAEGLRAAMAKILNPRVTDQ
jgi:acyl-CoA thioester hydrolase